MKSETRYFGTVGCDEGRVIEFPAGLPGFEKRQRFVLLEDAERKPVIFLQSLDEPQLCFLTLPVLAVDPEYRLKIAAEDLRVLDLCAGRQPVIGGEVECLVILAVADDGSVTANLLAPVVIHAGTRRAVQAVREDAIYGCRHRLARPAPEAPCL